MQARKGQDTLNCIAQVRLDDPAFIQLNRDYAEAFDRRWQEQRDSELEAERKLCDFVITF